MVTPWPAQSSITQRPDLFTTTGSLNTARVNDTATLLDDGTVLIARQVPTGTEICFQAQNLQSSDRNLYSGHRGPCHASREPHSYASRQWHRAASCGSADSSGNVSASAEIYNAATQSFAGTGSLNTARGLQTAGRCK